MNNTKSKVSFFYQHPLHATCYMLHATCYILHVTGYMLHSTSYKFLQELLHVTGLAEIRKFRNSNHSGMSNLVGRAEGDKMISIPGEKLCLAMFLINYLVPDHPIA